MPGSYFFLFMALGIGPDQAHTVSRMADRLDELGYPLAAARTRQFLPRDIPEYLRSVWEAVEYFDSADWEEGYARAQIEKWFRHRGQPPITVSNPRTGEPE